MNLTFLGAAGTVTGSKFLLRHGEAEVLLDCGLFQGLKSLRQRNWRPFPMDPSKLEAVVLTHAHLDHTGYLPALVKNGFRGPVYCTPPTADLARILLKDSGKLQEEDARYANRKGFSKHRPALPLYNEDDAEAVFPLFEPVKYHTPFTAGGMEASFSPAGHILGAASVRLSGWERSVLFSGDLGRDDALLIPPPEAPPPAEFVVMESTYGGKHHPDVDPLEALAKIANRTLDRGGILMIPSFAVGRAQALIYAIHELMSSGRIPRVPVFLNSPMAIDVTGLYVRYSEYHRLPPERCSILSETAEFVRTVDESKRLNERRDPLIVIAGAGMLSGGRILHHLKAFGGDERNTLVLVGFQAEGTRGAALLRGEDSLKIHGRYHPIRAEVTRLDMYSAHGDETDLLEWLGQLEGTPRNVFLVHGEPHAADALRRRIEDRLGFPARPAEYEETVELG